MSRTGRIDRAGASGARPGISRSLSRPALAWALAVAQILLLAQAVIVWTWSRIWFPTELAIASLMALAAVGALIVSRHVDNRLGWFLLICPAGPVISFILTEYVDLAKLHFASLPMVVVADWVSNWAWAPCLMALSMIIVRFPDGRVPLRWRFVDLLSVGGTIILAAAVALIAVATVRLPVNVPQAFRMAAPSLMLPAGLALTAAAAVSAVALLIERYRRGDTPTRQQLKWILLAAIVVALSIVYLAVVASVVRVRFDLAAVPLDVTLTLIPVSIGVAILRHRLFDIDMIINRTLVYVTLTAILGGLYVGLIELMERLFATYSGQSSGTAIVISAFVVAGAFTPIQKRVDRAVERRFGGRDAAATVRNLSSSMEAVVRVFDSAGLTCWLVDSLVSACDAQGGWLYLDAHDRSRPFYTSGETSGEVALEVVVGHDRCEIGRLQLGRRRGGAEYSGREIEALNRAAVALGKALVLGEDIARGSGRGSGLVRRRVDLAAEDHPAPGVDAGD